MDPTTGAADTLGGAPTGVWLLRCSLDIQNGVSLKIKSLAAEGDCDEVCIRDKGRRVFTKKSILFFQRTIFFKKNIYIYLYIYI